MTHSTKDLRARYGVGEHTILNWIHNGVLRAIDISRVGSSRPKWRIRDEDLQAFELAREHVPPVPRKRRTKAKRERVFYK